jgi:hypothetical protein
MTRAISATGPRSVGTFTYSGDPSSSDLDAVRFLTGDTNEAAYFLSDEEINFTLAEFTPDGGTANVPEAAGAAAEAIAAKLSREITYSADGVSVSADTLAAKFYTVAEKIRTLGLRSDVVAGPDYPGSGSPGDVMFAEAYDDSLRPLVFSVGMHDNYRGGQQDFGGLWSPTARSYDIRGWGGVASYASQAAQQARNVLKAAIAQRSNLPQFPPEPAS